MALKPWQRRTGWGLAIAAGLLGILLATDRFGNVLLGGRPKHTYSARCGLEILDGDPSWHCRAVCRALEVVDEDHCVEAGLPLLPTRRTSIA